MKVLLANPRGFCAGVDRAIMIVERTLAKYHAPIYVRHEVVHNRVVVKQLKKKGVIFVEDINEVPQGAVVVFSAHGVSQAVKKIANNKNCIVFDATCPLVTKVHKEVIRSQQNGEHTILIGHANHPEVEGTLGQCDNNENMSLIESLDDIDQLKLDPLQAIAYTTQTTLSVDDTSLIIDKLKEKYPAIKPPNKDDICYATQNRQDAVKRITPEIDILLVLGSTNSSNSNRLKEIALKHNKPAYLIDNAQEIDQQWFNQVNTVGVTAGASAPELLVEQVIDFLKTHLNANEVIELSGQAEQITFPLPKALR